MRKINNNQLFSVIIAPIVSEKSTRLGDKHRTIVFRVLPEATKADIKESVEKCFETKVSHIRVLRVHGKSVRFRGRLGRQSSWKKAYVHLQQGYDINLSELQ